MAQPFEFAIQRASPAARNFDYEEFHSADIAVSDVGETAWNRGTFG